MENIYLQIPTLYKEKSNFFPNSCIRFAKSIHHIFFEGINNYITSYTKVQIQRKSSTYSSILSRKYLKKTNVFLVLEFILNFNHCLVINVNFFNYIKKVYIVYE